MFESLDKIKWCDVQQAFGDGAHLPFAIRKLVDPDPTARKAAYWRLENYVVVQGDLFEAAFTVVPFLIEIFQDSSTYGRTEALDLLFEIANGLSDEKFAMHESEKVIRLDDACRLRIAEHCDIFIAELKNSKSTLRASALDLLISLRHHSTSIAPAIKQAYDRELDPEFKKALEDAHIALSE